MGRSPVLASIVATLLMQVAIDQSVGEMPQVAVITTAYYHNSHADMLASRILKGYTLDGKGEFPKLKLASLYTDQVPENDISRKLAEKYGVPIYDTVGDALTYLHSRMGAK